MVTQPRRSAFIVIFKLFVGLRNPIRPSERSTFIWHDLINPRIDLYKMAFYSSSSSSVSSDSTRVTAVSSSTIRNRLGLHARPAAMFVRVANKHRANIWVQKDGQRVNGKSILELMTLAAGQGTRVVISAEGADAEKAVQELVMLVQRRFDEE
jgi:phosphocarrier protein HPr